MAFESKKEVKNNNGATNRRSERPGTHATVPVEKTSGRVVQFPTKSKQPGEIITPEGLLNYRGASMDAIQQAHRARRLERNRDQFWTSRLSSFFLMPFHDALKGLYFFSTVGPKNIISAIQVDGVPYAPFRTIGLLNPSTWGAVLGANVSEWEKLTATPKYLLITWAGALVLTILIGPLLIKNFLVRPIRKWLTGSSDDHPRRSVLTEIEDPTAESAKMVLESMERKRRKRIEAGQK